MSVNLVKGQKVDLTKGNAGLKKLKIGLGWDVNKYDGDSFDLDASAFLLQDNGRVKSDNDFIYYNHQSHSSGAVKHSGDNLTGEGDGDDEKIYVNLPLVPDYVSEIVFTVTIYDAANKMQNFGMVSNSYIRIVNEDTNEELIRYDLGEDYSTETAMVMGRIYRHNGEWKFAAVGQGYAGGLEAMATTYGL